ncbi:MAG: hypothetical protein AAF570_28435, partial [Bacteroidota bacterium]
HLHDSGGPNHPIFPNLNLGLADYYTVDDEFLKFRLVRNGYPTVPLRMFEMLEEGKFQEGAWFWEWNGKPAMNDFVLDFRIRQRDIFRRDTLGYPSAHLYDLLALEELGILDEIHAFTKDRIVVVGDFNLRDMHETMYGEMAGPLILTNLYLALKNGDMRLPLLFPLLLFFVYLLLSYIVFTTNDFFENLIRRLSSNDFVLLLATGISYLLILGAVSVLCFILFNFHINFLFLALYFNAVEWLRAYILKRRARRAAVQG